MKNLLVSCLLLALLLAACAPAPDSTASGVPESGPAEPSASLEDATSTPPDSSGLAFLPMQENLSEDEIIAGCISYIESFYLETGSMSLLLLQKTTTIITAFAWR